MKASELRVGNWVQNDANVFEFDIDCYNQINNIEGVELTSQWLEKFGFELGKIKVGLPAWKHPNLEVTIVFYDGSFGIAGAKKQPPLDYVHQLQNFYFAMTGEELTRKTPAII